MCESLRMKVTEELVLSILQMQLQTWTTMRKKQRRKTLMTLMMTFALELEFTMRCEPTLGFDNGAVNGDSRSWYVVHGRECRELILDYPSMRNEYNGMNKSGLLTPKR